MDERFAENDPSGDMMEAASPLLGCLALVPNSPAKGLRRLLSLRVTWATTGVLVCRCTADVDCDKGEGVTVLWRD